MLALIGLIIDSNSEIELIYDRQVEQAFKIADVELRKNDVISKNAKLCVPLSQK